MKKHRILFRADGSVIAGYGHVMRLLSLAAMLEGKYRCVFMIREPDAFLKEQILSVCDELITLPGTGSYAKEAVSIAGSHLRKDDIVVLDGYNFTTAYQAKLKKSAFRLICIDDLHDKHFVADAVINHSEGIRSSDYSKESYTKVYTGSAYAILRRSFLRPQPHRVPKPGAYSVFISMGGTDQRNYTQQALKRCLSQEKVKQVDVVIGSYYPFRAQLEAIAEKEKSRKIRIHSGLTEQQMSRLMKGSDAGICSASTISYEYCSAGGLLFMYQTVDNQKNIYRFLTRSGCAFPASKLKIMNSLLADAAAMENYMQNRSRYFSGRSAAALRDIFRRMEAERGTLLRPATEADLMTYFKWANDPEVRQNAVNTASIPLEGHKKWFRSRLHSKHTLLFVLEKNKKPLGQLRFDRKGNRAIIDYSVAAAERGKGFGELMLREALPLYFRRFPADTVIAAVKTSNPASGRVFMKAGFRKGRTTVKQGFTYEHYSLQAPGLKKHRA